MGLFHLRVGSHSHVSSGDQMCCRLVGEERWLCSWSSKENLCPRSGRSVPYHIPKHNRYQIDFYSQQLFHTPWLTDPRILSLGVKVKERNNVEILRGHMLIRIYEQGFVCLLFVEPFCLGVWSQSHVWSGDQMIARPVGKEKSGAAWWESVSWKRQKCTISQNTTDSKSSFIPSNFSTLHD